MEALFHSSSLTITLFVIALSLVFLFEAINGFHDTANAVATVIYTNTLDPTIAVLWSGLWNFLGVAFSGGAVALSVLKLLPADLLALPDPATNIAMVMAIPLAAIIWNFGTWYMGLPASSSHTLIGSILGVGLMHSYMTGHFGAGLNWEKAGEVFLSLVISPVIGFAGAALLLFLSKRFLKTPALYRTPRSHRRPPLWIRGILILTCTGVSFAHGTNDGQKGIGLLMLVLLVSFPTLYHYDPQGSSLVIPLWAKLAVAFALGCGTMIGWRRVVITIGEKIGKVHMSYAQGAAAEIVATGTIQAASMFGLPVSTTHVLSSGIAGAMVANKSGLQEKTVFSILMAWIFTLPASVFLGSAFFGAMAFLFLKVFGVE